MARTIRNQKLDTRSARLRLPRRREPYWTVISRGLVVGYRKGINGGSWIARARDQGGRKQYQALGAADDALDDGLTALSFQQAQSRARDWFAARARVLAGDLELTSGPYTVASAMHDYLVAYERRGGKSLSRVRAAVGAHILPALGPLPLDRLSKQRIELWHSDLAKAPARLRALRGAPPKASPIDPSPEGQRRRRATANRVLTILKAALNYAHAEGRVADIEPWRRVRPFRGVDAARLRYLDDTESRRLVNACPPDFRRLVIAALLSGCRHGELIALVVSDFNQDSGTITIRASKSDRPRHIVLTAEGSAFFSEAVAGKVGGALMFTRDDGTSWRHPHQFRRIRKACENARIEPEISFHGLRHTYASRLVMKGVPLSVVAAQLGHSSTLMVEKHYGHLAPSYVAETVRASFGELGIAAGNVWSLRQPAE